MPGFGMNLCGMTDVRSFAQAQKHWEGEEPWRSEHTSWRPLQDRRKRHVRLVKLYDGTGYECVLYNTPMVTYYADGTVKLIGYDSVSSHKFAWSVTPTGISPVGSNGNGMFWKVNTPEGERFYRDNDCLMLTPASNGIWALMNRPAKITDEVLDLKIAASVRARLSHYDKWEKLTSRMLNDNHMFTTHPSQHEVRMLLESPNDPEVFAELRARIGPVENFRRLAYEASGAYSKVPVPPDRLPRSRR